MPESKVKDIRILRAINLINSNFNREIDFNALAEILNLSPSRLRHLFKAETGMSFRKYLRLVRMRQAKHLLESSFLNINEIAGRVGIGDSSHFVREFEKQYGLSPGKYQKNVFRLNKNQLLKHKCKEITEIAQTANEQPFELINSRFRQLIIVAFEYSAE